MIWSGRRRHDPAAGLGDLEAALAGENCPVCTRSAGADERWLDRFLDDGYLDRDVMRRIAAGGGFCAFHSFRMATIGQSATVALIYLRLIEGCLPRLAARRYRRVRPVPLFRAPDACQACSHQLEVERRECFFVALLIRARGLRCYGAPGLVCFRHLPPLLGYLDERDIAGTLALHREALAALRPEKDADPAIRMVFGPAAPSRGRPALPHDRDAADIPDPVRRMPAAYAISPPARSAPKSRTPAPSGWAGSREPPRMRAMATSFRMCCRCAGTTSGGRAKSPARRLRRRSPPSFRARLSSVSPLPPMPRRRLAERGACSTGLGASSGLSRRGPLFSPRCAAAASARCAPVSATPACARCRSSRHWSKARTGAALLRADTVCASAMPRGHWRCRTPLPSPRSSRGPFMPGWRCCAGNSKSSSGAAPGRRGRSGAASNSAAWLRAGPRFAGTP